MGTYSTIEQAILVQKIAKGKLTVQNGLKLSKAEVESKIRLAKEAVSNALAQISSGDKDGDMNGDDVDSDDLR